MSAVRERAGTHAMVDGAGRRWPVVEGIPFLRAGREALADAALAALEAGDERGAAILLLADRDDWAPGDPPTPDACAAALDAPTLREAMHHLAYGPVADYFAYRWSDPTYLAGLALLQQHWPGARPVVDVACGAGHLLRELARRGARELVGVDVVWAKLWLARRFVCPSARYVCADVTDRPDRDPPDLVVPRPAYVLCHDALYFLRDKRAAVEAFRALAGPGGTVVVGHTHVADRLSSGEPLPAAQYAALLGTDLLYDDAELTRALLDARPPVPAPAADLERSEAVALVAGDPCAPAPVDLGEPLPPLRVNPLYVDGALRWPSERYEQEYGPRSAYLPARLPDPLPPDAARRRLLVDLPESW